MIMDSLPMLEIILIMTDYLTALATCTQQSEIQEELLATTNFRCMHPEQLHLLP